jgi:hypothetical protein
MGRRTPRRSEGRWRRSSALAPRLSRCQATFSMSVSPPACWQLSRSLRHGRARMARSSAIPPWRSASRATPGRRRGRTAYACSCTFSRPTRTTRSRRGSPRQCPEQSSSSIAAPHLFAEHDEQAAALLRERVSSSSGSRRTGSSSHSSAGEPRETHDRRHELGEPCDPRVLSHAGLIAAQSRLDHTGSPYCQCGSISSQRVAGISPQPVECWDQSSPVFVMYCSPVMLL